MSVVISFSCNLHATHRNSTNCSTAYAIMLNWPCGWHGSAGTDGIMIQIAVYKPTSPSPCETSNTTTEPDLHVEGTL